MIYAGERYPLGGVIQASDQVGTPLVNSEPGVDPNQDNILPDPGKASGKSNYVGPNPTCAGNGRVNSGDEGYAHGTSSRYIERSVSLETSHRRESNTFDAFELRRTASAGCSSTSVILRARSPGSDGR